MYMVSMQLSELMKSQIHTVWQNLTILTTLNVSFVTCSLALHNKTFTSRDSIISPFSLEWSNCDKVIKETGYQRLKSGSESKELGRTGFPAADSELFSQPKA